ncbi:MAG: site-specific integrase [Bacteroidaceae bacterium]|nr:site-specific integrase [Bacteroidaceae bacterium]
MNNIRFELRTYAKSNEGYIWVNFYVGRCKVHFTTKVEVMKKNWSDSKQMVLQGDKDAKDKNLIIENIRARITDVFVKYRLKDRKLTKETFMRAYHRPHDYDTFVDFARDYMKKLAARTKKSTQSSQEAVLKKIEARYPGLSIDEVDKDFLNDFYGYMLKELGNNMNTANKNMTVLKKYVNAAFDAGYMDENPFKKWKIKKTTASVVYLTEEELQDCMDLYMSGELDEKHHKSLEVFLLLCFSSLHIGDARRLQMEQFTEETFTYYRQKLETRNPKPIMVPVSAPLRDIIHNMVGVRKKGPVIEKVPADQTMNECLKDVSDRLELNKKLSLKVGRHTFATIFLRKTKDLACLKEIMGHSEFRETLVYAHVLSETKIEGVSTAFAGFSF